MDENEDMLNEAYETNFGTSYETYKNAIKRNPSIRLQYVKYYLNKLESVQTQFKYTQYKSVVSRKPLFEFEVDLLDLGTTVKPMRCGLVAVDGVTKVVSVIPIKHKQVNKIRRGLEEAFATMGTPHQIYTDEEGAMTFINKHNFKHIQLSTHAHTAERFIQTFRMNVQRRLDATKESTDEWTKHVSSILNTYNNTIHNTIEIEPNKAKSPSNFLRVAWHLQNAANNNIKYPEIKENDYVRVNIKSNPV